MFLKTFALTIMFGLVAFAYAASAPVGSDSIKGEWAGAFSIAGQTATATFKFDVHGKKVTGTINSEHTGPGTVTDGKWENGKLTCTLKFEKHESITFSGSLKSGKLVGEFATEGMTGTWTAIRK